MSQVPLRSPDGTCLWDGGPQVTERHRNQARVRQTLLTSSLSWSLLKESF